MEKLLATIDKEQHYYHQVPERETRNLPRRLTVSSTLLHLNGPLFVVSQSSYQIEDTLRYTNHLWYKDDLNLVASRRNSQKFSQDFKMDFGLGKCAEPCFIKSKLEQMSSVTIDEHQRIKSLDPRQICKYHGIKQGEWFRNRD